MKKKIFLYIILILSCTMFTISLLGIIPAYKSGAYIEDADYKYTRYNELVYYADDVYSMCTNYINNRTLETAITLIEQKYDDTPYNIQITALKRNKTYSTDGYVDEDLIFISNKFYNSVELDDGYIIYAPTDYSNFDNLEIRISLDWPYHEYNFNSFQEDWAWNFRIIHLIVCLVSLIGIITTTVFIALKTDASIPMPFVNKTWSTPFALINLAFFATFLFAGFILIQNKFVADNMEDYTAYIILAILSICGGYFLGTTINGIIKKIKDRTFYPQLFVSKIGERYGVLGQGIYIAILTFVLLLTCGLHTMFNSSPAILFAIVIVIPLWITFIIYLNKFTNAFNQYAAGDWSIKLDEHPVLLSDIYANLHTLGTTMQITVEKSIRDERTKGELITNVSHDIKTPLTSIINYTDLLKNEDLSDEERKEYLEVLSRNSARMKKLLEDLIEASKASTGNIELNMAPCNLNTLISQSVAEHDSNATLKNLKLIYNTKCESASIYVDGAKLFRVFDNLLSNACKYSLTGSRIFVNSTLTEDNMVVITFKNTSEQEITISPEELTERFVRGDMSRNSDGSGLGLAIAKSLTELMAGTFEISIDGDQFNAVLTFPLYK